MSKMTKNAHAVDNSVAERRLRAIYEWLDCSNNKKALQECDKVLKKTPNFQCARALKALTLHRMGKDNDAVHILDELTQENPTDEPTLQAMTLCCREMEKLDRIIKLYESAAKVDPSNEEIQTQLFMSHVRVANFKASQNVAMILYKHRPKNPYYCWAVMSIILQATRGEGSTDPVKKKLLLSLAERMMVKLIQDNKLEAEQEVQLYVMVLEALEKYDEILQVLHGPLGKKLTGAGVPQMKIKYLKLLNRWAEVNVICKVVLLENVDRWDIWLQYIESVLHLENGSKEVNKECNGISETETPDDTFEKAHEFICRIVETGSGNNFSLRGPYLARFELCSKLRDKGLDAGDMLGDVTELFIEYFRKFGYKPCCVSDLRLYLRLLDDEKKLDLATRLIKDVGINSSFCIPLSVDQMQRHIGALQLSRLCGSHRNLTAEHQNALVTALSLHYNHGHQNFGTGLLVTDMGPADGYALLAAHVLSDLAELQQNSDYLLVALVLLSSLLKNSPSNFHAKLLALKINHNIGNVISAQEMYSSLEVKHLQLDSLGYAHCARLPTTGLFSACGPLYDTTISFFTSNYKDSSDHLTFSYKFGSFLKLDEFMDFRERLRLSLHCALVEADRAYLDLVEGPTAGRPLDLGETTLRDGSPEDSLRNNYDAAVYASWDPERVAGRLDERQEKEAFTKSTKTFLKLRTGMLTCLRKAFDLVKADESTRPTALNDLDSALRTWNNLHKEAPNDVSTIPVRWWPPSRLDAALQVPSVGTAGALLELLVAIAGDDVERGKKAVEQLKCGLCSLNSCWGSEDAAKDSYLPQRRRTMETIVNCTELVSVSSLVCGLCCDVPRSRNAAGGRKSKKKSNASDSTLELVKEAVSLVADATTKLAEAVEAWSTNCATCDATKLLEGLSLGGVEVASAEGLYKTVVDSHGLCVREVTAALKSKAKYLNTLTV